MALPAWPTVPALPYQSLVDGFDLEPVPGVLESEMEGGNSRARRRSVQPIDRQQIALRFTPVQLAQFRTFFATTLGMGASRFTMPVWVDTDYVTKTVRIEGGKPNVKAMGVDFVVSFSIFIF